MIGYLAIRKSTLDGLTDLQRRMVNAVMRDVTTLAEAGGNTWQTPGAIVSYLWHTTEWDQDGMAILGALAANLASVTGATIRPEMIDYHGRALRAWVHGLLTGAGLITNPEDVPHVEGENRMQEILDANGASQAHVRFFTEHPQDSDDWTIWPTPPPPPDEEDVP